MSKTKEQLILSLNDKDESERLYSTEDISDSGEAELSVELINRLKIETSEVVKNSILSALQKMEHRSAYLQLFKLFSDEDAFLRNSAVSIYGSYDEEAVTFLSSYLDHSNKEVRKLILDSLVGIANNRPNALQSVLEILRAYLHDPEINVVITAVEYIGELGDVSSLSDLSELFLRNTEPMLAFTILDVILKLGTKEDLENALTDLFQNDFSNTDTFDMPQMLRLLAQSGRKEDFLTLVNDLSDISYYSEVLVISIDWLVKMEDFQISSVLDILFKILEEENLREDLRYICVRLLLASREERAMDFVREIGLKGNEAFHHFCRESSRAVLHE